MYVYVAVYLVGNIHEERSIQVISSMLVELRNGRISIYVEDVSLNTYSYPHTQRKKNEFHKLLDVLPHHTPVMVMNMIHS
jgi:hypothetical protein